MRKFFVYFGESRKWTVTAVLSEVEDTNTFKVVLIKPTYNDGLSLGFAKENGYEVGSIIYGEELDNKGRYLYPPNGGAGWVERTFSVSAVSSDPVKARLSAKDLFSQKVRQLQDDDSSVTVPEEYPVSKGRLDVEEYENRSMGGSIHWYEDYEYTLAGKAWVWVGVD